MPANVEVVMFDPAAVADLKSGEKIFVVAGKKRPNSTVLTPSIVVDNGVDLADVSKLRSGGSVARQLLSNSRLP